MDDDIPIDLDESSYADLESLPAEVLVEDLSPSFQPCIAPPSSAESSSASSSSSSCENIASTPVTTPTMRFNQTASKNPSLQHIKVMYVGEVVTITAWQGTIDTLLEGSLPPPPPP